MSVSIAAQLGVLPISLFYFHQFPGLFFLSNLTIIPFLGIILGVGIIVIILALTNLFLISIAVFYTKMITVLNLIVGWISTQESFIFRNISFDTLQVFLGYTLLACLFIFLTKRTLKRLLVIMALVICFQSYLIYANYSSRSKEEIILMHQTKNTISFHRVGNNLSISTLNKNKVMSLKEDYVTAERIETINHHPIQNEMSYRNNKYIL
ncbi:MAG: competence protein ComEC [Sediminicola sp.]|jgi:competence protein ComEC|tara:strand:- start:731 stop:1357 length:627 start_codon:yes stop_codon:yes gene_type:complete